jgi:hypothetical protein
VVALHVDYLRPGDYETDDDDNEIDDEDDGIDGE